MFAFSTWRPHVVTKNALNRGRTDQCMWHKELDTSDVYIQVRVRDKAINSKASAAIDARLPSVVATPKMFFLPWILFPRVTYNFTYDLHLRTTL